MLGRVEELAPRYKAVKTHARNLPQPDGHPPRLVPCADTVRRVAAQPGRNPANAAPVEEKGKSVRRTLQKRLCQIIRITAQPRLGVNCRRDVQIDWHTLSRETRAIHTQLHTMRN